MNCGASFRFMDWKKAYATTATVRPDAGEELDEHEIWDAMASGEQSPSSAERNRFGKSQQNQEGFLKQRARVPNASSRVLMIPRSPAATDENANANANAKNANPEATVAMAVPKSAPMNIPDWSKMRRGNNFHQQQRDRGSDDGDVDDDDDDDDEMRIPPHELVARQLARSQITSFSVFEGAGRTLKGRDVIRVRNAVLTRTGFLE